MLKQMTVMFCPLNLVGCINAAIGMGEVLRDAGHRVVFAVNNDWNGKLIIHGFEEEIIGEKNSQTDNKGSAERNVNDLSYLLDPMSRIEKLKKTNTDFVRVLSKEIFDSNHFLEEIVNRVKPDVILIDNVFWIPSLMGSGIPWVLVNSCNPLIFDWFMNDEKLPPSGLGMASTL